MTRHWLTAALAGALALGCSDQPKPTGPYLNITVSEIPGDDAGHSTVELDAVDVHGAPATGPVALFSDYGDLEHTGTSAATVTFAAGRAQASLDCTADARHCIAPKVRVAATWGGLESESGTGVGEVPEEKPPQPCDELPGEDVNIVYAAGVMGPYGELSINVRGESGGGAEDDGFQFTTQGRVGLSAPASVSGLYLTAHTGEGQVQAPHAYITTNDGQNSPPYLNFGVVAPDGSTLGCPRGSGQGSFRPSTYSYDPAGIQPLHVVGSFSFICSAPTIHVSGCFRFVK